jgi:hypothetical protein
MPRFMCSGCHEVVELSGSMRFEWCSACGEPLSRGDMLPVRLVAQASNGPAGSGADVAAPALAATTSPIAASSRPPSVSPPTT